MSSFIFFTLEFLCAHDFTLKVKSIFEAYFPGSKMVQIML